MVDPSSPRGAPLDLESAIDDAQAGAALAAAAFDLVFDRPTAWAEFGVTPRVGHDLWLVPTHLKIALDRAIHLVGADVAAAEEHFRGTGQRHA